MIFRKLPTSLSKIALLTNMTPKSTTMAYNSAASPSQGLSALDHARKLSLPPLDKILARDGSVYQFWDRNDELLEQAWVEWNETQEAKDLPKLDASLLNPKLRQAVEKAWAQPTLENEKGDSRSLERSGTWRLFR
jgi:hypothetical protein